MYFLVERSRGQAPASLPWRLSWLRGLSCGCGEVPRAPARHRPGARAQLSEPFSLSSRHCKRTVAVMSARYLGMKRVKSCEAVRAIPGSGTGSVAPHGPLRRGLYRSLAPLAPLIPKEAS